MRRIYEFHDTLRQPAVEKASSWLEELSSSGSSALVGQMVDEEEVEIAFGFCVLFRLLHPSVLRYATSELLQSSDCFEMEILIC